MVNRSQALVLGFVGVAVLILLVLLVVDPAIYADSLRLLRRRSTSTCIGSRIERCPPADWPGLVRDSSGSDRRCPTRDRSRVDTWLQARRTLGPFLAGPRTR